MAQNPAEIAQGPILIGTFLNILLYGIMIAQTFAYFTRYPRDPLWTKIYVAVLFVADTLHAVFSAVYIYDAVIINFGVLEALGTIGFVFETAPALTAIIGAMVQFFFAYRIQSLTRSFLVPVPVIVFALGNLIGGLTTAVYAGIFGNFADLLKFKAWVILWLASASAADILITGTLVLVLRRQKTGFAVTDSLIDRILRLAIQTGMATALCAFIDLLLYLLDSSGVHLIFNTPLSKLYSNALMSRLNSRHAHKAVESSNHGFNSGSYNRRANVLQLPSPQVFVEVESHEMADATSKPRTMSELEASNNGRQGEWEPDTKPDYLQGA